MTDEREPIEPDMFSYRELPDGDYAPVFREMAEGLHENGAAYFRFTFFNDDYPNPPYPHGLYVEGWLAKPWTMDPPRREAAFNFPLTAPAS